MLLRESLEGRVAIVTGAARGNGAAIARGLAARGAAVVVTDLEQDAAERTAGAIRAAGGRALALRGDVVSREDCSRIAERACAFAGAVSILVNNAGILTREGMDDPALFERWERAMSVNVSGVLTMTTACVEQLRLTKGSVVNIASIAGFRAVRGSIGYSTSKAAVTMLTRTLAVELAGAGVRVNAIAPGFIDTPMTEHLVNDPERSARILAAVPMARFGIPDDLVGPVLFLVSSSAAYITGAAIPVDGGYLAA